MRALQLLAVLAMTMVLATHAAGAGLSDEELTTPLYTDSQPVDSTVQQRALLQTSTGPTYPTCINGDIKEVFTAKIAVLMIGNSKVKRVYSGDYVKIISPRITKRLKRYNAAYRLNLSFSIIQRTSGFATNKAQKWFYYDITFVVGKCGRYKFPLITQLRGDIQPGSPIIKRARLLSYPFKK